MWYVNVKWGEKSHYMICKVCNTNVPICFEEIMDHIVSPWHHEKLQNQQLKVILKKKKINFFSITYNNVGYIMWKFFNYVFYSLQEFNMGGNINSFSNAWGIFHMMFNIYTYSRIKYQKIIILKTMIRKMKYYISKMWKC